MELGSPGRMEETLYGTGPVFPRPIFLLGPLSVVAIGERFDEVPVLDAAVGAAHSVRVVREEVQSLVGEEQRLRTAVALEPLRTARHGGEDVVGVHGSQD